MIIGKTLFPELVEAFAIGSSVEYIKKYTDLCSLADAFPKEFKLMYKWKSLKQSSDMLNELRDFVKDFIILGPELDVPTLLFYINKINNTIPKDISDTVKEELKNAFVKVSQVKFKGSKAVTTYNRQVPIDKDNDFLNMLADALSNCNSPCNYLEPMSDSIGSMTTPSEMSSKTTTPLWDTMCTLFQDPVAMTMGVFNKIPPTLAQEAITLQQSCDVLIKHGLKPFFSPKRIQEERQQLLSGKSITQLASSYILQPDSNAYLKKAKSASQILGKLRAKLGDCYRIFEFQKRYNPHDRQMNLGLPKRYTYKVNNNGYLNVIDMFGRVVIDSDDKKKYSALSATGIRPYCYESTDDYSLARNYNVPPDQPLENVVDSAGNPAVIK